MGVYNISGELLSETVITMPLEIGDISGSTGCVSRDYSTISTTFRSAFPLEVEAGSAIAIEILDDSTNVSAITLFEYSASSAFIKSTDATSGVPALNSATKYVKFKIVYTGTGHNPDGLQISVGGNAMIVKNLKVANPCEYFVYEVYPGVCTSGALMLPPNYKPNGKPVPLLVFAHGSNGYASWGANLGTMTGGSTYFPYMEYLRDEGFAIFDCFPITSKYISSVNDVDGNTNFWSHIAMAAYTSGVEYVLSRYNIDQNDVNLYCKSLGGQIAAGMANISYPRFKTISMLCPWINNMTATSIGWSVDKRTMLADDWGLTGNVSSVFLQSNFEIRSEAGQAFLTENLPIISGVNPAWRYCGRTAAQKFADIVSRDYTKTDYCRTTSCPVKIWGAQDDTDINFNTLTEFVAQAENGGCDAFLRVMPNGTGGHHSVDTDASALKSSGTTALGISYTNVPTAYVEIVEFIRSRP